MKLTVIFIDINTQFILGIFQPLKKDVYSGFRKSRFINEQVLACFVVNKFIIAFIIRFVLYPRVSPRVKFVLIFHLKVVVMFIVKGFKFQYREDRICLIFNIMLYDY